MNWSTGLSWLSALKARRDERRPHELDHADMGTAFGLDASFGPADSELSTLQTPLPPPAVLPWEHRLTRRSSL